MFGLTINNVRNLEQNKFGVFVKEDDHIKYKIIDVADELEGLDIMWIINRKVLQVSDQNNHRPFLLLEPEKAYKTSYLKICKIKNLYMVIFDQQSQSVAFSQIIENPFLQEIKIERFNAW